MTNSIKFLSVLFAGVLLFSAGCKGSKDHPERDHDDHGEQGEVHREEGGEEGHGDEIQLSEDQMRTSKIKVVKAEEKYLAVQIEVLGEIASDTDRVIQIRPDNPGTVREINVAVGDTVNSGKVLVRYDREGNSESGSASLKAPKGGVVVGLYSQIGGHVDPAVPLVTLADTSKLRCGLDVYEKDIGRVRKGQPVKIKVVAFPDEIFYGKVTYISPRVDENSRTVKVRVDITNRQGKLKFGMFVTGFIEVSSRKSLVVPKTAIQKLNGKPVVFIEEEPRTFEPKEVTVGDYSDGMVEIVSGLDAGESVVSEGSFIIKSEVSKAELGGGHSH